ncbi:hypothetical protein SAMN06273570_3334 [Candidatus Pantoea floridensis]|uniref:Uncharacterized protein n=1 Tax=Candidatus Pantoea floridensis TaxID=1938870 RepID=A0A286BXS8_9GAMM|nr:hypothetical protein BX596_0781 [Enterobacteriaceae bacterium JKS000233]SOD38898.1 hypothetical protein SAMN06273570_3334 [Pantoea floridensis]
MVTDSITAQNPMRYINVSIEKTRCNMHVLFHVKTKKIAFNPDGSRLARVT